MKTILTFSGGLDSIYALWLELTTTDNEVTAVYYSAEDFSFEYLKNLNTVEIENKETSPLRWYYVQQIAEVMRSVAPRSFTLVKEKYDPSYLDPNASLNFGPTFRAAHVVRDINDGKYDRFISGINRDNDGWFINNPVVTNNDSASSNIMDYFIAHAIRGEIAFPLMEVNYTPAMAFSELPPALLEVYRSCQINLKSTKDNTCDLCYKCMMHKYVKRLMSEGKTPSEIYELYTDKSTLPNGKWKSQKIWLAEEIPGYNTALGWNNIYDVPRWGHYYKVPNSQ